MTAAVVRPKVVVILASSADGKIATSDRQPPVLAIWGKNEPFFGPAGAEAFKKDVPDAWVELLDIGHFALETHGVEIVERIRNFLDKVTRTVA